jgi:hypothetical protein
MAQLAFLQYFHIFPLYHMRKSFLLIILSGLLSMNVHAQDKDKLFGNAEKVSARNGFILNVNGNFDIPGGDMAQRFGLSYRIGPGVLYKTASNWIFGVKCDFILGGDVHQDSLMSNIKDAYNGKDGKLYEFINNGGQRVGVPVYERGYAIGVSAGKIIPFSDRFPDNGLMLLATAGFIQHKIDIYDRDKTVEQLRGNYLKGYDRLTNGAFVEGYAGYVFFANNRLLNFTLGLDALFGFTQGRRDYLYDVMRPDNQQRLDVLFGIHGAWFVPMFKRKSEDMLFE